MQMIPYATNSSGIIQYLIPVVQAANSWKQVVDLVKQYEPYIRAAGSTKQAVMNGLRAWWGGGSSSQAMSSGGRQATAPVAFSYGRRQPKPKFKMTSDGGYGLSKREFVANVTGNTTFGVTSYTVQPGIASNFNWVSSIATSYEQYKITRLKYEFVPIAGTDERGRVTLAFDRDPLDADPNTMADLYNYAEVADDSVWRKNTLNVRQGIGKKLFTRFGTVSGTDLKTYDMGKFLVGVASTADTAVIGQLFVEYEISFYNPQPGYCPAAFYTGGGTISKTAIFGDAATSNGQFPGTVLDSTITFNAAGTYHVSLKVTGVAPGLFTITAGTATNLTNFSTDDGGAGNTKSSVTILVRASVPGETLVITNVGTSVTGSQLVLSRAAPDING